MDIVISKAINGGDNLHLDLNDCSSFLQKVEVCSISGIEKTFSCIQF